MRIAIITPSYRGDFEICKSLCASVDRYLPEGSEHLLLVPKRDMPLFETLGAPGRRILTVEEILPGWMMRLPLPARIEIPYFFSRRLRELYLHPQGLARGWIIQQILKLSAPTYTNADIFAFADSDIEFIRPLDLNVFQRDGRVRLYRVPGATRDSAMHHAWHRKAAALLGIPSKDYFGADFIGNIISWRRDVTLALQERIAKTNRADWRAVIARQNTFSEYILYGIFADEVMGADSGHFASEEDLSHCAWHYDIANPIQRRQFISDVTPRHVAIAIQSTLRLSLGEREGLIASLAERQAVLARAPANDSSFQQTA